MPEFGLCMTAGHHPKNNNPGLIGVFSTWHKEGCKKLLTFTSTDQPRVHQGLEDKKQSQTSAYPFVVRIESVNA